MKAAPAVRTTLNAVIDAVNGFNAGSAYLALTGSAFTGAFSAPSSGYKIIALTDTAFTSADVHSSASLTAMSINGSANITTINVTGCSALETFDATGTTALTAIPFSSLTALTTFVGTGATSAGTVSFAGDTSLTSLTLAAATTLDLSGCSALATFDASGLHGLTSVDIDGSGLTTLIVHSDNLATFSCANCAALTQFEIAGTSGGGSPCLVTSLDFTTLTSLAEVDIWAPLSSADLSHNTTMDGVNIQFATFASIDLSHNTVLTTLILNNNANLASISLPSLVLVNDCEVTGGMLPTSTVNAILVALAAGSVSGGFCDLRGQTPAAPPSGAGAAAVITLQGRAWNVNTD